MLKYILIDELKVSEKNINERIINVLKENKYIIKNRSNDSIDFKDNLWQIRWNWETLKKIDKGKFTIKKKENKTYLELEYYISYQIELIILITTFLLGLFIFKDYSILIISIIFWIQFLFRVKSLKEASQDLLNEIQGQMPEK